MTSHAQPFFEPPSRACQIVLVRHGQSEPYVEGRPFPLVAGHGDPALSSRGHWQAERLGERLSAEPVRAIYTSSLTRTKQTAAPLAHQLGIEPVEEHDLREIFLGEFEGGLFRQRAAEGHPAVIAMRESGEWGAIPGAESNAALAGRVLPVIERLAKSHPDELIVVVCHGGVIASILGHAMDTHPMRYGGARNASISHLVSIEQHWVLRAFNDASHTGQLTFDHDPTDVG